ACRQERASLASCEDEHDCDALGRAAPADRRFWIGVRLIENVAVDLDDSALRIRERFVPPGGHWNAGLDVMKSKSGPRRWANVNGAEKLPALCRRLSWQIAPSGHAYLAVVKPMSWSRARDRCQSYGAHLATITSETESREVHSLIHFQKDMVWFGATAGERPNSFDWVTSEPFEFRAFKPGEPDNTSRDLECLLIDTATWQWHDRSCASQHPSLCERDSVPGR